MNNLNSILIEGNMVRDPLMRSTPKGTPICSFSIATNRFYRQESNLEKEVGFFDVEAWGKLANSCINHGRKGRGVRVVGRLKQDRWVGNDGKNHTRVAIVAEHVEYRPDFKRNNEANARAETNAQVDTLIKEASVSPSFTELQMLDETKIEELQALTF